LNAFSAIALRQIKGKGKAASTSSGLDNWDLDALTLALELDADWVMTVEKALLRQCLEWVVREAHSEPCNQLEEALVSRVKLMLQITDLRYLPEDFRETRELQRHFHLHIGPTNSGKTYNALKALTKANTGAYAGPLRLLAHEVWERLNRGTVGELKEGQGRECNLLTGEERRVVSLEAGLMSCTVEMLPLGQEMDVVVIDEIQMIGDPHRGAAWTSAIMGVAAKEIHLCGEETVVAVVTKLVEAMGDKITIHRYERLTPLKVADESLEGDLGKVEDGDCVVAFSRSGIFATKKAIEEKTGKRCAVVYGALPPETRSEQAKLFNEEGNGVNIMVASDAVGMGLNLKIKRIVFEAMHKFNGKEEVPLSVSQVKQIAGRAGRFGLHNSSSSGGVVTTLNAKDLPLLKTILPGDLPPVPRAVMDPTFERISQLALLMTEKTSYSSIMQLFAELARLPQYCVFSDITTRLNLSDQLTPFANELSLQELETFTYAPVNIRDDNVVSTFQTFIRDFVEQGRAKVEDALEETGLMDDLALVSKARDAMPDKPAHGLAMPSNMLKPVSAPIVAALPRLESLHKALVLYIWLSLRLELGFPERARASELKQQTEELLDFCLERLPGVKQSKKLLHRRAKGHLHHDLAHAVPAVKKEKSLNWMTREDMADLRMAMRYGNIEIMDKH